jgi:chromosome partitioning protein
MEIFRLAKASEFYNIPTKNLTELLSLKLIPHIKKTSSANRSSYYIPSIFVDYAKKVLNAKKVENLRGEMKDFHNKNGTKIITISNLKGGVGKTSVASNFAYALAVLNKRVLLVDMDSQANTSRYFANKYFTGNSVKNIFDALMRKEKIDKNFVRQYIGKLEFDNASLDLLPSELALGRVVEFSRAVFTMPHKKLNDILKHVKEDYDFIVIDTPPSTGLSLHMAIYASDMMSIVTDAEDFSVNGLKELASEIQEIEEETDRSITVDSIFINKVKNSKIHEVYIEAIAKLAVEQNIEDVYTIADSTRVKEAQNLHIPMLEYKSELDKGLAMSASILEYAIEKALEG